MSEKDGKLSADAENLRAISRALNRDPRADVRILARQAGVLTRIAGVREPTHDPASRRAAIAAASSPSPASTSSVCWPMAGGARCSTGGVSTSRKGLATVAMVLIAAGAKDSWATA